MYPTPSPAIAPRGRGLDFATSMRFPGKHAFDYVPRLSGFRKWAAKNCNDRGSVRSDLLEGLFAYHIMTDHHQHLLVLNDYLYTHYIAMYLRVSFHHSRYGDMNTCSTK